MNQEREAVARTLYGFAPLSRLAVLDGGGEERQEIPWDELTVSLKHEQRAHADLMRRRADTLLALRSGGEGWRLVPPIATAEMLLTVAPQTQDPTPEDFRTAEIAMFELEPAPEPPGITRKTILAELASIYRAMLAAAPSPSTHGEG